MSSQEAVYHLLPLSYMSRLNCFINTCPISERNRILKPIKNLIKLDDDSEEIFQKNIFERYSNRPIIMNNDCLAKFVCMYKLNFIRNLHYDIVNEKEAKQGIKSKICILTREHLQL